ncbi:DUF2937 family protein [Glaciecola sp. SC05]|uniref:DUF2937 family protein n=1 Tax=Glaciecola sp. SC05 TaxID=1987355 RepID=UPI0035291161
MLASSATYLLNLLRLIVFAVVVLIGVQIPGFVGQYQSLVNAHLSEAKQNLSGFQQTAQRYFLGDIDKLITHYRQSQDQVFVSDAENIQAIVDRVSLLNVEALALQQHPLMATLHVSQQVNSPLFIETLEGYQWAVPLNSQALFWGLGFAILLILLFDIFGFCCKRILFKPKHKAVIA